MPTEDTFTIVKNITDLRLKEELNEVYCYMDFNKQTVEPMYNDELKLPINIIKMVQKKYKDRGFKVPTKKAFSVIKDVKISYDKENNPDIILLEFWTKL